MNKKLLLLLQVIAVVGIFGIPAFAEHLTPADVTDVYASIEYQIVGVVPNERVQLDIEFFDHQSNHLDMYINYDIEVRQENGHKTQNGSDRMILYTPSDYYNGTAKVTYLTEELYHTINGQRSIIIELNILGVGLFEPYPIEFESENPTFWSFTRNNGNSWSVDLRP